MVSPAIPVPVTYLLPACGASMPGLSITSGAFSTGTLITSLVCPSTLCEALISLPAGCAGMAMLKSPFSLVWVVSVPPVGNVIIISAFGSPVPVSVVVLS